MNNIQLPYFYNMFQDKFRELAIESEKKRIGDTVNDLSEIFDFFYCLKLTPKETLEFYDKSFEHICHEYIVLAKLDMNIIDSNIYNLIDSILNITGDNEYQNSFLFSIQCICADYLQSLGKGKPVIMSSLNDDSPSMEITIDSRYKINQFDFSNMDLLEQSKCAMKLLRMEVGNQIGPIPYVKYRYRKDI